MKKNLFLWLMLIMLSVSGMAQEIVTIGEGNFSTNSYFPSNLYYKYSVSQQLYTAGEIGVGAGQISTVSFMNTETSTTRDIVLYMGETSPESFSSASDALGLSELTEVYSGQWQITKDEWSEINLTTPYDYTGGNLVIVMLDNTGGYLTSSLYWRTTSISGKTLYRSRDSDGAFDLSGTIDYSTQSYRPDVQLTITTGEITCHPVSGLAAGSITSSSAVITWTEAEDGGNYTIMWKKSTDSWDDEDAVMTDNVTGDTYELTQLDAQTIYNVRIINNCGSEVSSARNISFKTACGVVDITDENSWLEPFALTPECWTLTDMTYFSNSGYIYHPGGNYTADAVSPVLNVSQLTTPYLKFFLKLPEYTKFVYSSYSYEYMGINDALNVYYRTVEDEETGEWTLITSVDEILESWTQIAFPLPEGLGNIQLKFAAVSAVGVTSSHYDGGVYIDSVNVYNEENPLTCFAAMGLEATNITAESADLKWSTNGYNQINLYLKASSDTVYAETENVELTEGVYTVGELSPNTTYQWYLATICDEDTLTTSVKSFTTLCSSFEVPHTWSFDNTNEKICWTTVVQGYEYYDYYYYYYPIFAQDESRAHTGEGYVQFGSQEGRQMLWAAPAVDANIEDLRIEFYVKNSSASAVAGPFLVGVMSDIADSSTFVPVATITDFSTDYELRTVDFNNAGVEGTGYNIAFRYFGAGDNTSSGGYCDYFSIDDITIKYTPACLEPSELAVSEITATSANLTWTSEAGEFKVYCKKASEESYTEVGTATENEFSIETLEPSTVYTVYVATVCDDGSESASQSKTFVTECVALVSVPHTWDMEAGNTGGTSSNPLPACWTRTNETYPYVASNATYAHGGTRYIYFNTSDNTAILAQIDAEALNINELQVSFYARSYNLSDVPFIVGVMTDPTNANSFDTIATVLINSAYEKFEVPFSAYEGDGTYVALRSTVYCYVDDVTLENIPECSTPSNLAASATEEAAELSWESTATDFNVFYRTDGASEWQTEQATVSHVTISNLSPSTIYQWYVEAYCDGDTIRSATRTFSTACGAISTLPYTMNFDNVASNTLPDCWSKLNPSNDFPKVTEATTYNQNAYSGNKKLEFHANPSSYAILPVFAANLSDLQVKFFTRREGVSSGSLEVGYITNPADTSTFVSLFSISSSQIGDNNYRKYIVQFDSYEGDEDVTPQIAFKYNIQGSFSSWYWYVDDVVVENIPLCPEPSHLALGGLTNEMALLTWHGSSDSYTLYYKESTASTYTEVEETISDTVYTLGGLTANTTYSWYVVTNCEDGTQLQSDPATFSTACEAITTIPQTWDFESGNTGGTTSYPLPTCWTRPSGNYPYVYESSYYSNSGTSALIYSGYSNSTVVMAPIDPESVNLTEAQLSLYLRGSSSEYKLQVGYITDPGNAATFSPITTLTLTSSYDNYIVSLPAFEGSGYAFIALRTPNEEYVYVDDVTLEAIPECSPANNLDVSDITLTTAVLNWNSTGDNFNVYYKVDGDTVYTENTGVTETSFPLSDLTPSTSYQWYVQTVCDDTTYTSSVKTFTTVCTAINSVPRTWDFEAGNTGGTPSSPLPVCWSRVGSNNYPYASVSTAHGGTRSLYFYTTGNTAVLPQIDAEALNINELQISFYARTYSSTNIPLIVGVMTDPTDASTFMEVATVSVNSSYELFEVPFNEYTNGGAYVALKSGSYTSIYIDDVTLENIPACPKVKNIVASNITENSATITWIGESENGYNVKHRAVGTEEWTNDPVATSETTTITGLESTTTYEVAVAPICDEEIDFVTATFMTACGTVTSFPYVESFETGDLGCWTTEQVAGTNTWTIGSGSNYSLHGSYYVKFPYNPYNAARLISPIFDLSGLTTPTLSYALYNPGYDNSNFDGDYPYVVNAVNDMTYDSLGVYYKTSSSSEWVYLASQIDNNGATGYSTYTFTLPEPSATYQIMFLGRGLDGFNLYLDNIRVFDTAGVDPIPVEPTVVTNDATDLGQTTATLKGTISDGNQTITARGFEWKAVEGGTVAVVNATGNNMSYQLSGLTASTEYTFRAFATTANTTNYGDWKTFTTLAEDQEPCNAPTNVTISDVAAESFVVTWNANGASKWNIRYRVQNNATWTSATVETTPSYTVTGLQPETAYEVQVQAVCENETSEWSASATATTTTGLSELSKNIILYPNPATNFIDVRVSDNDVTVSRLEVYDVYGKLISEVEVVENPTRINVSTLAGGMYFVKVVTGNGTVTKSFIRK